MRVVVPTKATRTLLGIKKKRNKHQRIPNIGLKRRQQQGFVHMFHRKDTWFWRGSCRR